MKYINQLSCKCCPSLLPSLFPPPLSLSTAIVICHSSPPLPILYPTAPHFLKNEAALCSSVPETAMTQFHNLLCRTVCPFHISSQSTVHTTVPHAATHPPLSYKQEPVPYTCMKVFIKVLHDTQASGWKFCFFSCFLLSGSVQHHINHPSNPGCGAVVHTRCAFPYSLPFSLTFIKRIRIPHH